MLYVIGGQSHQQEHHHVGAFEFVRPANELARKEIPCGIYCMRINNADEVVLSFLTFLQPWKWHEMKFLSSLLNSTNIAKSLP